MGKLWKLAYANIKKTKSVSVTLACLFFIAALLLNLGLLIVLDYGSYFSSLRKELNNSDAYITMSDSLYNDKVEDYLKENEHVKEYEDNQVKLLQATSNYQDKEQEFLLAFNNMDQQRKLSKWKYVGDYLEADDESVYLPDIFKSIGGYEINDKISFKYHDKKTDLDKTVSFTIKGFIEDIYFCSKDTGFIGVYVPEKTFSKLDERLGDNILASHILFMNFDQLKNLAEVDEGLRTTVGSSNTSVMGGDMETTVISIGSDLIELSRCMMAEVIASMMIVFAVVIIIVCLLVVRFRIKNSLEEDVLKIGSLKSVGYTNRQIILSILLQFVAISGIGSLIGILLSYPCIPAIATVFEQQSGLLWTKGFDLAISTITLAVLLAIVVIIVLLVARNVKKLSPVLALRGEMVAKKVKRNYYPMETGKGNLSFLLIVKSVVQNTKQNIMIVIILIAVTFAGGFGVVMFYNTSIDTKAFAEVPGMEICNIIVALNQEKDVKALEEQIDAMKEVRKAQFIDEVKVKVELEQASCTLMEDYDSKETKLVYEGSYPKKKGEIALAGVLAERIGKEIDDTVSVTINDTVHDYTIVGLTNGSSMGGINCCVLLSDYKEKDTDFKQQLLYIYTKKEYETENVINLIQKVLPKDSIISISNFDKELEEGMASYQDIVGKMGIAMLVITLFVVALVLYFMISSTIVRTRRELGIKKALGFTTFELMNQFALSFMVPVFVGTVIGSILAATKTNALMSISMKGVGIMKANFIVDGIWVVLFAVGVALFSYLLALLITSRIRKISAYALVTE